MREADVGALRERLAELADTFSAKAPSKQALTVWTQVLKDFPIETICDAFTTWAKTKTKMPAPADIAGICAARLSDRIESEASARKGEYARGSARILADPRVARMHLERCLTILKGGKSEWPSETCLPVGTFTNAEVRAMEEEALREWRAEREAVALQDDPL